MPVPPGSSPEDLVEAALNAVEADRGWLAESQVRALAEVQAILAADDDVRRLCVLDMVTNDAHARRIPADLYQGIPLLSIVARRRLQLAPDDIEKLFEALSAAPKSSVRHESYRIVTGLAESAYPRFDADDKARLRPLLERAAESGLYPATANRLRKLLGIAQGHPSELIGAHGELGARLRECLDASAEPTEALMAAVELFAAFPLFSGWPPKKWYAEAERVRHLLAAPAVLTASLLEGAIEAGDTETRSLHGGRQFNGAYYATAEDEAFLCGAATFAGVLGDAKPLAPLRRLAAKCVTIIGRHRGPRSMRIANVATTAIASIGGPLALTELLALERSVRHGTLLRQTRKAIDSLAATQGLTREELLQRAVETHGLDPDGSRTLPVSRGALVISVDARSAGLAYVGEDGVSRKAIPAHVKETDAEAIAEAREQVKAIRTTLAGERHRLDGLLAADRRWPVEEWRRLYLDHPITGRLARSLIWTFSNGDAVIVGIPHCSERITTSSSAVAEIPDSAEVRLWHPVLASHEEVHAWRMLLLRELIVQPFKQAYREVYVLAPAERQTRIYSNRFAGHIFRQAQARSLMKGRGWKPVALAWWDNGIDHGVARRTYEPLGIRAEFFYEPISGVAADGSELFPYCSSDQMRFFGVETDAPLNLVDVPPRLFSEAMRDADLFVGVTSIGADPEWLDRGEERRFDTYWYAYGFGELTAAAEIRREVLEQLLPRLAIAQRCELDERFLRVRGDLRSYRIHLGSANILMSPNDEYLCIHAARDNRAERLFLPFNDDPVLSLILSKAFLLAEDTAIADPTIVDQIKRGRHAPHP